MDHHDIRFQAAEQARGLIKQVLNDEITVASLQERFRKIKSPEPGVEKRSPVEQFMIKSGAMRVTDPCYEMETWCAGTLENVKNGLWTAFVGTQHDNFNLKLSEKWRNEKIDKLVAADSFEELTAILGKEDHKGVPYTEADLPNLIRLYALIHLDDTLRECLESEIYNASEPVGWVWYIHAHHPDHPITEMDETWVEHEMDVGVDSGQAGFFDLNWYAAYSLNGVKQERGSEWDKTYSSICDKTLETKFSFGCVEFGAVSSSGYGYGVYTLYYKTDDEGKVIATRIVFIGQEEEEEEDDEE